MSDNYYHILGVPRDADSRQIRRAYHRLAREHHPDKASEPEQARAMEEKFALASTAYNVLKDQEKRAAYDRKNPAAGSSDNLSSGTTATAAVMNAKRRGANGSANRGGSNGSGAQSGENSNKRVDMGLTPERASIAQKAYVKGVQLLRASDPAKAVEFFDAAIANNDAEPAYYAQLGTALIQAKKSASRAIEVAQIAIDLEKYNLDYKFNLAQIYETIGSKTNATKVYEEILRWDADNVMAKQMLRTLNKKNGLLEKLSESSPFLSSLRRKFSK